MKIAITFDWSRRRAFALALILTALVALPRFMEPEAKGHGTHEQLGLPACRAMLYFHIPCPLCGATTAFAEMTRGRVFRALRANVFGSVLYVFCLVTALLLYGEAAGRPSSLLRFFVDHLDKVLIWGGLFYLLSWLIKIAIVKGYVP